MPCEYQYVTCHTLRWYDAVWAGGHLQSKGLPELWCLDPLEVVKHAMMNPALADIFAYRPELVSKSEFKTSHLNTGAWWHLVQAELGPDAMIAAVMSGCDGVLTTTKDETVYFYIRLGNIKAPWCFEVEHTYCIGVMPDLHQNDGIYENDEAFQRARAALTHDAIAFMFEKFNAASHSGMWMQCPDGLKRWTYPLLAFHCVDHKEALRATNTKKTTCTGCSATEGHLDNVHGTYTRKTTVQMRALYMQWKDFFLNPDGSVKEGKAETLRRFEAQHFHGCRFMWNSFWAFRFFCVYTQTPPESLHLADLGLFQSILVTVFDDCKGKIFDWLDNGDKQWDNAMNRLQHRLHACRFVGTEVPPHVCKVGERFTKSDDKSTPLFKAWQFRLLMLVGIEVIATAVV